MPPMQPQNRARSLIIFRLLELDELLLELPPSCFAGFEPVVRANLVEVVVNVVSPSLAWAALPSVNRAVLGSGWLPLGDKSAPSVVGYRCKALCPSPLPSQVGSRPLGNVLFGDGCFCDVGSSLDEVNPWFKVVFVGRQEARACPLSQMGAS